MAKNTYYIVFENNTDGKPNKKPVATNKKTDNQDEKNAEALMSGIKGYASLKYAENVVDRVASQHFGTVELRTGHAELQQKMQFKYGVTKGIFDTIIASATAGSIFGGVGVVLGAVAGVADWGIGVALRQNEINMRQEVENTSLFYSRIRAGAGQDRTGRAQ